jgi:hypothetical protein
MGCCLKGLRVAITMRLRTTIPTSHKPLPTSYLEKHDEET